MDMKDFLIKKKHNPKASLAIAKWQKYCIFIIANAKCFTKRFGITKQSIGGNHNGWY